MQSVMPERKRWSRERFTIIVRVASPSTAARGGYRAVKRHGCLGASSVQVRFNPRYSTALGKTTRLQ